jgi:hypothetical protein
MHLVHRKALVLGATLIGTGAIAGACFLFDAEAEGSAARTTARRAAGTAVAAASLDPSARRRATSKTSLSTDAIPRRTSAAGPATSAKRAAPSSTETGQGRGAAGTGALASATAKASPGASRADLTADQKRRLADALSRIDWDRSLKDLVAAARAAQLSGQSADPGSFVQGAQVRLALAQAAEALGLAGPKQALQDPSVRSVVVPAWLGALGVNLDPNQSDAIADQCLSLPTGNAAPDASFLQARETALQARIALEQTLSQTLTPEQLSTFAQNVPSDPLMKGSSPQMNISASSTEKLTSVVASYWTSQFQLDGPSQAAAQTVASQYVAEVMALPPVAPNLDPEALRLATLQHTSALVTIQQQAEQSLAQNPALTPAQSTRATTGSPSCLRLGISH